MNTRTLLSTATLWWTLQGLVLGQTLMEEKKTILLNTISILGENQSVQSVAGSAQVVPAAQLEKSQTGDVHRVLSQVPGVYLRDEEGFGLRPNIGMRGSGSERSAKIALMEDGILIAPAPYSAPAAYYFPILLRMQRMEVLKGPSAVKYGPNTVGGAINLISRDIPSSSKGQVDVALGDFAFGKFHVFYGSRSEQFGWLLEGVALRTDGFQHVDGGSPSGFDKNDFVLKWTLNTSKESANYHRLDFKIAFANEKSDASYLGLTEKDYKKNPYRRYQVTEDDEMVWHNQQYEVRHYMDLGTTFDLTTIVYEHRLSRTWNRLDGVQGAFLRDVLAHPNDPAYQNINAVLTGQSDSTDLSESLFGVKNERHFTSHGVQWISQAQIEGKLVQQHVEFGLRLHEDVAERDHLRTRYLVDSGSLESTNSKIKTDDNYNRSRAMAFYAVDEIELGNWKWSPGIRYEQVLTFYENNLNHEKIEGDYEMVIPGIGLVYHLRPQWELLAGVHKGFVPVSPGQIKEAHPEESVNYETGFRYKQQQTTAEFIGFFNDYSNIKGTCTYSSGCENDQLDQEFDGGRIHVYGAEAQWGTVLGKGSTHYPLHFSYTFTQSSFENGFESENPQWGTVKKGDELPYQPKHLLSLSTGVQVERWELQLNGSHTGQMRDVVGQGTVKSEDDIPAHTVFDSSASYHFVQGGTTYLSIDNLLNADYIASRRPYGIHVGKPRQAVIGHKITF